MPSHVIKDRLVPYRILAHLLYTPESTVLWLERLGEGEVRVVTGVGSRALRMKIANFREALYWLLDQGLVESVTGERKRGTLIIKLKQPTNM